MCSTSTGLTGVPARFGIAGTRAELDDDAIGDIRLALNQGQPLGRSRFADAIERATGQRREVRPRGRPRKVEAGLAVVGEQLGLYC